MQEGNRLIAFGICGRILVKVKNGGIGLGYVKLAMQSVGAILLWITYNTINFFFSWILPAIILYALYCWLFK